MTTRGKTKRYSINYELIYGKEIRSRPRKRRKKMDEKYYICTKCGYLTTETQILKDLETIGSGDMCVCQFDRGRILIKYTEISKEAYDKLNGGK